MRIPPKPADVLDGSFGAVGDQGPISQEVLVRSIHANDSLTATISAGAPYYRIASISVGELQLERDEGEGPPSSGGVLVFWQETTLATSDGSTAIQVSDGQRIHVNVVLDVPKAVLAAGAVQGVMTLRGADAAVTVALQALYTPTPAPTPDPGPIHPGPLPQPGGGGDGGGGGATGNCVQLRLDRTRTTQQLAQFEEELRNTPGPEGPGTPRDQVEQAIALLQQEIAAIEASIVENGCDLVPVGGPKSRDFGSPIYGSVTLGGAILDKWNDLATHTTSGGQSVQDFLGPPVRPTRFVSQPERQVDVQEFERGVIIDVEGSGTPFVVYGAIHWRYRQLGGFEGPLGAPVSDEADFNPGRVAAFEGGQIFWDPIGGSTHEMHGAILQRWLQSGGASGPLGFPTTDEMPVLGHEGEIGRSQLFQGGGSGAAIYWSPATGASELLAPIYNFWLTLHGGVLGDLGFPTGAQGITPAGTAFHTFQNGIVAVPRGGAPAAVIGGLKLQLFRYVVDSDFNVQIDLQASTGQQNQGRMPADGQYPAGSQTFGPDTLLTIPAIDHGATGSFIPADLVISLHMEAISQVLIGKDDRKGTIDLTYNIDSVWGLQEPQPTHQDQAFTAEFAVQPIDTPAVAEGAKFRSNAFWPFRNFVTDSLSWAQYERTFRDVVETDKHINLNPFDLNLHIFEILFYETVYRSMGQPGTCFGLSLESVYARSARSPFIEPIFSSNAYANDGYPANGADLNPLLPNSAAVADELSVKHGYQLGADFVGWFLGKWTAGALRDPVRAFRESRDAYARGDWPLLTVSNESELTGSGHVIVPYAWQGDTSPILPGQRWEILCANPNYPAAKTPDDEDSHCKVVVRPFEQEFEFQFSNDFWTGSSTSGGRLLTMPFSILSSQPVLPGDEIFSLLTAGVILIVGDGGQTTQLSDQDGRTLFAPEGGQAINPDPAMRVPGLMPVPHRQATPLTNTGAEVYYWQRDAGPLRSSPAADVSALSLHHDVASPAGLPCRVVVHSTSMLAAISADQGSPSGHRVSLHNLGSATQKIVVHAPADATQSPAPIRIQVAGWQANRAVPIWFELQASLGGSQEIHLQVANAGSQLTVLSVGADALVDLRMLSRQPQAGAQPVSASRLQLPLGADQVIRFDPASWKPDELPGAPVNRSLMDSFGGTTVLAHSTI